MVSAHHGVGRALVRIAGRKGWTFRVVLANLIGARAVRADAILRDQVARGLARSASSYIGFAIPTFHRHLYVDEVARGGDARR